MPVFQVYSMMHRDESTLFFIRVRATLILHFLLVYNFYRNHLLCVCFCTSIIFFPIVLFNSIDGEEAYVRMYVFVSMCVRVSRLRGTFFVLEIIIL